MKSFASLFLFAFMIASLGDANNRSFGEWWKLVDMEGSEEMHGRDLYKEVRTESSENLKMFSDSSLGKENIKHKMVEKIVIDPTGFSEDEGKEKTILEDLRKRFGRSFEESEAGTARKIFSFGDVSERMSFIPLPSLKIPMDLNLRQVKDLLEGAMGFGCDDGKGEMGPGAEMEKELLLYCGLSKVRCMPEKVRFRRETSDVPHEPCCHPQRSRNKRKDKNLQMLDDMMNEMLGLPCGGRRDGMAKKPVLYCGFGKMRRLRPKSRKNCEGSDAPSRTACSPIPRLYQPSDMDLRQLSQVLDGIMGFPIKNTKEEEKKPNELEMNLMRFCAFGKMLRMPGLSNQNWMPSVAFNKASCNSEQNVRCPADLDFEEVNDLMEEVMEFAGKKEKKGQKIQDLQDWLYGYCGFGKVRRLSFNSVSCRNEPSSNPLEGSDEHRRKLLNRMEMYVAEMLGFDCKGGEKEEIFSEQKTSAMHEFCGFGQIRFLPENYFLDWSKSNTSKLGTPQIFGDPLDLSLSQANDLLVDMMGLRSNYPEEVIPQMGGGLFLFCGPTKLQFFPELLDIRRSSSDVSNGNTFSSLPIM